MSKYGHKTVEYASNRNLWNQT